MSSWKVILESGQDEVGYRTSNIAAALDYAGLLLSRRTNVSAVRIEAPDGTIFSNDEVRVLTACLALDEKEVLSEGAILDETTWTLVYQDDTGRRKEIDHPSRESAKTTAERLALHKDGFHVLAIKGPKGQFEQPPVFLDAGKVQ